ncbi:hypothetical protein CAPTEDRAFT_204039 [Capitella teleta]|uniref:Uncharacterized protein n=1 Tax=Capitella teleta TaxID=283909 RepID=R7TL58_CAPTE|nr:hypothetical protein CAPTEDRAFT_204039 [Capitella teleta]|eukprot:ELT94394.1 hypothetical protein CAPTEDRAFT_204039 [Capitella teleta]
MSRDSKDCPQCHIQVKKRARKCPNCQQFFAAMRLESQQAPSTSNPKGPCISREKIRGETRVHVTKMTEETYALSYESQRREESKNYGHLDDLHAEAPSDYSIGKPLFINPCSREAVAEVFRDIGRQAGLVRFGGGCRLAALTVRHNLPKCCSHSDVGFCLQPYHVDQSCKEGNRWPRTANRLTKLNDTKQCAARLLNLII